MKIAIIVLLGCLVTVAFVLFSYGYSIGVQLNSPLIVQLAGYLNSQGKIGPPYIEHVVSRNKSRPSDKQELAVIIELLNQGFDVDGKNPATGDTALIAATNRHDVEAVRLLLQRGADPGIVNNSGLNAALRICGDGEEKVLTILKLLVAYGWDVRSNDSGIKECLELARSHADSRARNGYGEDYSVIHYLERLIDTK